MLPVAQGILRILTDRTPLFQESPTATIGITPTVALTPSPVVDPTPTIVVLPPLPAPAPPSPWEPGQWLRTTGWSTEFHGFFLVIFLALAVAAVFVYYYLAQRRFRQHKVHARFAQRASIVLTVFSIVGLILLLFAVLRAPLLSAPLWLLLSFIALIAAGAYALYYYVNFYPSQLAQYARELERQRYLPKARTKGPAKTPPMTRKRQEQGKAKK